MDDFVEMIEADKSVAEAYLLVTEVKLYIAVPHPHSLGPVKVRIYRNTLSPQYPFTFELSHHVHTPVQAGPYHPSATACESEAEALRAGIRALTSFVASAVSEGHSPSSSWLIENEDW